MKLNEETPVKSHNILKDLHQNNLKHHLDDKFLSNKLHKSLGNLHPDDEDNLREYADDSEVLNNNLIKNKHLSPYYKNIHDSIHNAKHEAGHEFHAFSGVHHTLGSKIEKLKSGDVLHSPAHMSFTHEPDIAQGFAMSGSKTRDNNHIIHLHIKPEDKIVHISKISHVPFEHETIIPSGSNLKYHGSSSFNDGVLDKKFIVHHMSIHSQD